MEGDLVAESVQAADVVTDGALGASTAVVVGWAEVCEGGLLVGEQVPDDSQD